MRETDGADAETCDPDFEWLCESACEGDDGREAGHDSERAGVSRGEGRAIRPDCPIAIDVAHSIHAIHHDRACEGESDESDPAGEVQIRGEQSSVGGGQRAGDARRDEARECQRIEDRGADGIVLRARMRATSNDAG
jgi:hypothetical protein